MASVELNGLTKWYGKRRGVDDLNLNIADKEFVAMFGPAGAGKTTTLNLIAGIVTPNRGTVKIAGRDIDGLEPAERNVAMVFESYALYPRLSVFDNMAFPLRSLVDAAVKARDGTQLDLEMLGEKIPMPVPTDVVQVLNKKRRGKVRIGFRPSDVNILPDGTKSAYHGVVYSFEPLGAKSILTVQAVDGKRIRALVDGHLKFEMDRRVQFAIEPHSILTFDADTQEFLARSELPAEEVIHG